MRSAGIAELKASLSETLARVKAGEEVLVTEHGRPIAKIVPLSAQTATDELVRSGVLRVPERPLDEEFWQLPRPQDSSALVRGALLKERREGR
ncbi:MAG TPA: type II toxin-antitoxin system prevent-host-death family antitoxin [Thermoanaerobaculia bacterium]|nr:type II toxin-antitoxin system prevent-host-death family antitoxin [Thermoanaerobaculia bacterium]